MKSTSAAASAVVVTAGLIAALASQAVTTEAEPGPRSVEASVAAAPSSNAAAFFTVPPTEPVAARDEHVGRSTVRPSVAPVVKKQQAAPKPVKKQAAPKPAPKPVKVQSSKPSSRSNEAFLKCVVARESGGDPKAQNRYSSASGLFQFIDGTWRAYSRESGIGTEYSRAKYAPASVQWALARWVVENKGRYPWRYPPKPC